MSTPADLASAELRLFFRRPSINISSLRGELRRVEYLKHPITKELPTTRSLPMLSITHSVIRFSPGFCLIMSTKLRATIEDLYRVPGKAEIVDGEIVHMSPTGAAPSYAASQIFKSLDGYSRLTKSGFAVSDNAAFRVYLANRESFSPDVAFHTGKWTGMKFFDGAPVFAVEVRSEGDYGPAAELRMAKKRTDYFAAGTLVVWDVNLLSDEVIKCYSADNSAEPHVYRRGETAKAELALPGWSMLVDDLFIENHPMFS